MQNFLEHKFVTGMYESSYHFSKTKGTLFLWICLFQEINNPWSKYSSHSLRNTESFI